MPTGWANYYHATAGRPVRELFTRASAHLGPGPGRLAIDLGCGDGTETLALLDAGWRVLAVDASPEGLDLLRQRVPTHQLPRLETRQGAIEDLAFPSADFIYGGLSLFFCAPASFARAWRNLRAALLPGGIVAAHLLGNRDTWASEPSMTSHTGAQVQQLLQAWTVLSLEEVENDHPAVSGPKHWHLFEVIARRESGTADDV